MFTGIVEGLGTVKSVVRRQGGLRIAVRAGFPLDNLCIGDSICVSGACLTVVHFSNNTFDVDIAPETLSRTTLGRLSVGDLVNLERALRLGERLGGHLVTGHVDGIGTVRARRPAGNAILFTFVASEELSRYIIQKGSVAVDGISLTVNACHQAAFDVSIVPHTLNTTTMGFKKPGDRVNIETDIVGKYVERFTQAFAGGSKVGKGKDSSIETVLKEEGFI
ncbi:MAG: riboflavin synthase [Deltaproteobacteria bacterium]|nr:MAG: riboflavin synthase [Deltaproteobacteria bacterium]